MLSHMAGLVTAVIGSRKLEGPGWQLATERPVERAERLSPNSARWSTVLGIRRGLKLLVTGDDESADLLVEAWAGEPGDSSDGIAVVAGSGPALARVPLCGCGDRGCGNAGVQLSKQVAADDLPELAAVLRALPWTDTVPTLSNVLRGDGLAALPMPDRGGRSKIVHHDARMQ
jgi:hypothetical protein